jgi:hypothetical protein
MWNLGDPPSAFSSTGSDGIPLSMSYQYTLGNSGLESSSNIVPSFHNPILDSTQPASPSLVKAVSPALKNKIVSVANKSAKIRKSMSTPNVRGQATADAAALALSAEKRRNKLGYHRTSVACGKNLLDRKWQICWLLALLSVLMRKNRTLPSKEDSVHSCSS